MHFLSLLQKKYFFLHARQRLITKICDADKQPFFTIKKKQKTLHKRSVFYKIAKKTEIIAFCYIIFEPNKIQTRSAPQNKRLNLSFVKDIYIVGEKLLERVVKQPFISLKFLCLVSRVRLRLKFQKHSSESIFILSLQSKTDHKFLQKI